MSEMYDETREQLRALRMSYGGRLPTKVGQLEALLSEISRCEPGSQQAEFQKLYLSTHTLTGTSASYGFNEFSRQACLLENYLKSLLALPVFPPDEDYLAQIAQYIQNIKRLAEAALSTQSDWNF